MTITDEQRIFAWKLVSSVDFGKRGKFDGSKRQQYAGVLGETIFADLLGLPRPTEGYDGGIDFTVYGKTIDLKTMERKYDMRKEWVNNLLASQVEFHNVDYYMFANINSVKGEIQFLGHISKRAVVGKYTLMKAGTVRTRSDGTRFEIGADNYEVPVKDLNSFRNIDGFKNDMLMGIA